MSLHPPCFIFIEWITSYSVQPSNSHLVGVSVSGWRVHFHFPPRKETRRDCEVKVQPTSPHPSPSCPAPLACQYGAQWLARKRHVTHTCCHGLAGHAWLVRHGRRAESTCVDCGVSYSKAGVILEADTILLCCGGRTSATRNHITPWHLNCNRSWWWHKTGRGKLGIQSQLQSNQRKNGAWLTSVKT